MPTPLRGADLPVVHLSRHHVGGRVDGLVREGTLVRVRRGAHVEAASLPDDPYARARHLAVAHAVAVTHQTTADVVVSHASAALLWGLPVLHLPSRTHVVQRSARSSSQADDVVRHTVALLPHHVTSVAGMRTTVLARTAVDCARSLGGRGGLVVTDGALRAGATRAELDAVLAAAVGGRGARRARAVLALADGGAESVGETLARAALLAVGLPVPVTQLRVPTADGVFWADLGWPELRLLAEYDGRLKYGDAAADVGALVAEKRREDLLRDEGWTVLRLMSADLARPALLRTRVERAVGRLPLTPRPYLLPSHGD